MFAVILTSVLRFVLTANTIKYSLREEYGQRRTRTVCSSPWIPMLPKLLNEVRTRRHSLMVLVEFRGKGRDLQGPCVMIVESKGQPVTGGCVRL